MSYCTSGRGRKESRVGMAEGSKNAAHMCNNRDMHPTTTASGLTQSAEELTVQMLIKEHRGY